MLDPIGQAGTALRRLCSILMNYGARAARCAPSAKTDARAGAEPPAPEAEPGSRTDDGVHVEIRFTVDDEGRADEITGALLTERLVACGQRIGPIVSRYWWSGTLERSSEWLVLTKTRSELADRVIDTITAHHPYETPEVVVVPLVAGLDRYLGWIDAVTGEREPDGGGSDVD